MAYRIPVRVAERNFPSINQARIHYRDILHNYQPGQAVSQDDSEQVLELLSSSGGARSAECSTGFRVVHGNYGRKCFASVISEKGTQMISITRSVKLCAVPSPSKKAIEVPLPVGITPTTSSNMSCTSEP